MVSILLIGAGAIILWVIMSYNGLVAAIANAENQESQIDVQIDTRFKIYENLSKIVSKAMDYEKSTLAEIVKLRSKWDSAGSIEEKQAVEREVNALGGINVVMEAYPDLKANQNTLELQREVVSTERKLAFAKQAFNDAVASYNTKRKSFPTNIIASTFSGVSKEFSLWELAEEDKTTKEAASINL